MTVELLSCTRMLEVVGLRRVAAENMPMELPAMPGDVHRDATDRPDILHFAPGRWLVLLREGKMTGWQAAAQAFAVFDVCGKWLPYRIGGQNADLALASTIDIAATLDGRACASTLLFDCPAVIARGPESYLACVPRSFGSAFESAMRAQLDVQLSRHR